MSGVEFEGGSGESMIDLSDVSASSFEVLPKGMYEVIVADAEGKISQSSGNPMISLTLEIAEGEFAGRKLFTHVVFAPKTLGQAKRTMVVLGLANLTTTKFSPLDPEIAAQFIGKRAKAKVAVEKYEDEDTNRVKNLLPVGGGDGFSI